MNRRFLLLLSVPALLFSRPTECSAQAPVSFGFRDSTIGEYSSDGHILNDLSYKSVSDGERIAIEATVTSMHDREFALNKTIEPNSSQSLLLCGLTPRAVIQCQPSGVDSFTIYLNSDATGIDSIRLIYHNSCAWSRLGLRISSVPAFSIDGGLCTARWTLSCFPNVLEAHRSLIDFRNGTVLDTMISATNCNTICAIRQFSFSVTNVERQNVEVPTQYRLEQGFPNPFNPTTTIEFSLPHSEHVTLIIYDQLGQEIETLVADYLAAGEYSVEWNAGIRPSGVYYYRLQAGSFLQTKKLVLLK